MGTAANIIISGARVLVAPTGEAEPDETTVAYGAAWGGNWDDIGFTSAPLAWAPTLDTVEAEIQQSTLPIKRQVTKERHVFETALAELTSDNLAYLMGGTVTTTVAGVGQVGYDQLEAGGEVLMDEYAVGFEGMYVNSSGSKFPIRVFLHKATLVIGGKIEFNKEAQTGIPFRAEVLEDSSKADGKKAFKFVRVTAPAT